MLFGRGRVMRPREYKVLLPPASTHQLLDCRLVG